MSPQDEPPHEETAARQVARARAVQADLVRRREEERARHLQLIRQAVPEIVADADAFLDQTDYRPWEFGVMFAEGDLGQLLAKYAVGSARHRPSAEFIAPRTDLFYEACELIDEQKRATKARQEADDASRDK